MTLYNSWQQNAFEKYTNEATSLLNISFKQFTVLHKICCFVLGHLNDGFFEQPMRGWFSVMYVTVVKAEKK